MPGMTFRRTKAILAAAAMASIATVAAVGAAPTPAHAATPPVFTLGDVEARALAVEPTTGRVFIAAGDKVLVRNADGSSFGSVANMYGVDQLAVGGGSVYALLQGTTTIARINASTLAVTSLWTLTPNKFPVGLAFQGGKVWFTAQDTNGWGRLVSIDPGTGTKSVFEGFGWDELRLEASPNGTYLAGAGENSNEILLFDVTGAEPVVVTQEYTDSDGPESFRFTADSSKLEVTSGAPYDGREYSIPSLEATGVIYDAEAYPVASATSGAAGGLVAVTTATGENALRIYKVGTPTPGMTVGLDLSDQTLEPMDDGTEFSPDGTRVYVAYADHIFDQGAALMVVPTGPKVTPATLPVLGTRGGAKLTFTGTGLTSTNAYFGGTAATPTASSNTSLSVTAPVLTAGTKATEVRSGVGIASAAGSTVVIDLGPFRNADGFTTRQYADIGLRVANGPDLAAASTGLRSHQDPGVVIMDLVRAEEWSEQRAPLIRLYKAVFLRAPDSSGMGYWLGKVQSGTSLTKVAATMAGSSEFKNRYGSLGNGPFVDLIYQNVLGRGPDPSGRAYWVKKLGAGTSRGVLVNQFAQSSENVRKRTDEVEIIDTYLGLLRRVPGASELSGALQQRTDGASMTTIAASILRSTEYRNRIG